MDMTLDYPHIYLGLNGKEKRFGGVAGLLRKMGYEKTEGTFHMDTEETVNIRPISIGTSKKKAAVPIFIHYTIKDALKTDRTLDNVLVLQLPGHSAWNDRVIYSHYEKIRCYLEGKGIRHYCPNPPKDLRKSSRDMN